MKLKALFLSLMILLPLAAIAAPINAEIEGPVVWVNPNYIKKWAPCQVSSTFDVEVKLWNKAELTGVGVYAFDFYLSWLNSTFGMQCSAGYPGKFDESFISLVNFSFTAPWDHYFVIKQEILNDKTMPNDPFRFNGTHYFDLFHLAITALDNSEPLTEAQVVLAKLTFHIDCEPLYEEPNVGMYTPFHLTVLLSDMPDPLDPNKVVPLPPHEVDDGYFWLRSYQPDVHLKPKYWCETKKGVAHTVELWLSNMSKVYGFGFAITYNRTLLEADVQSIVFCDAFPPPYEYLYEFVYENFPSAGFDTLVVEMRRPCEKPTVTHQAGPAATFSLVSKWDGSAYKYIIPTCDNSTIDLRWAYMLSKCGCAGDGDTYTYLYDPLQVSGLTGIPMVQFVGEYNHIHYYWRPQIGDLNLDGVVDIQDLQALAKVYGLDKGPWNSWGGLDSYNEVVDIFDFVVVAKYFGKPHPCIIDLDTLDDVYNTYCWGDP